MPPVFLSAPPFLAHRTQLVWLRVWRNEKHNLRMQIILWLNNPYIYQFYEALQQIVTVQTVLSVLNSSSSPAKRISSTSGTYSLSLREQTLISLLSFILLTSWVYTEYIPLRKPVAPTLPHSRADQRRRSGQCVFGEGFPSTGIFQLSVMNIQSFIREKMHIVFCRDVIIIKNSSGNFFFHLHDILHPKMKDDFLKGRNGGTKFLAAGHMILAVKLTHFMRWRDIRVALKFYHYSHLNVAI